MARHTLTHRTTLLALLLSLTLPLSAASTTASATAGATIVDRISVSTSAADESSTSPRALTVDSTSRTGPLAVSIEVGENDLPPRRSTLVADHAEIDLTPSAETSSETPSKRPVVTIVHTY